MCQKAPRFALDSNDAERLLIRLLDKGPLCTSTAKDTVAAVTAATLLLDRLAPNEYVVRRRLAETFVRLCAPTACSPPDSFFGRNALVSALRGLRKLGKQARHIAASPSSPPAYFDGDILGTPNMVWLSRLLCDRGAECRAAAYQLAADCASFDFGYDLLVREGDPLDALLAALVTPSRREAHAANASERALRALSEDNKKDPAFSAGACHLALALTVAPAPSQRPEAAGYAPLKESVARHCSVLASVGGVNRKQACVLATKASERIGEIKIDAQHPLLEVVFLVETVYHP